MADHAALFDAYAALLLVHATRGEIDSAVTAAATLYHMSRPDWFLSERPSFCEPVVSSPLAEFLQARGAELRMNWPQIRDRLSEGVPPEFRLTRWRLPDQPWTSPERAAEEGQCALEHYRYWDAARAFETAIVTDPDNAENHLRLGQALTGVISVIGFFQRDVAVERAWDVLNRAVDLAPDDWRARFNLMLLRLHTYGWWEDPVSEAMEDAKAIRAVSESRGVVALARIHRLTGETEAAETLLREAMATDVVSTEYGEELGMMYQMTKNFDRAFALFDEMIERHPHYMPFYYQYARTAVFAERNVQRGIERMIRYLSHEPDDEQPPLAWAHYRLGMLKELVDEPEAARQNYEKALELDAEHDEARVALARIDDSAQEANRE
jgi:tetratricopeptide (TPR) repeat protein